MIKYVGTELMSFLIFKTQLKVILIINIVYIIYYEDNNQIKLPT